MQVQNNSNVDIDYRFGVRFSGEFIQGLEIYVTLPNVGTKQITTQNPYTDWFDFGSGAQITLIIKVELSIDCTEQNTISGIVFWAEVQQK